MKALMCQLEWDCTALRTYNSYQLIRNAEFENYAVNLITNENKIFNCITMPCQIHAMCNSVLQCLSTLLRDSINEPTTQLAALRSDKQRLRVANSYIVESVWLI
jgi:hypothetical protein